MGMQKELHVTRTCDVCGNSVSFIAQKPTPEQMEASSGWFVIATEYVVKGQLCQPSQIIACSKKCAQAAIEASAPPSLETTFTESGPIDLGLVN
jgi:hypothetical protein